MDTDLMSTDLLDTHPRSLNRLVTEKRQGPKSLAHSSVPAHPLDHQSPVQPDDKVPSCPGSSIAQALPAANLRVAPKLASGSADGWVSELPRLTRPAAQPAANFRVAPNPLLRPGRLCIFGLPRILHQRPSR